MKSTSKSKTKSAGAPLSHGVGRRKAAVARIWLRKGTGKITVNGKDSDQFFDTLETRIDIRKPFTLVPDTAIYDVVANVKGGGFSSQAGAIRLGIARAIVAKDETKRAEFKKFKLLTVDARKVERKKYGQKGARAKFQFVKR